MEKEKRHWEKDPTGGYVLKDERGRELFCVHGDPDMTLMLGFAALGDKEEARKHLHAYMRKWEDRHPELRHPDNMW